MNAGTPRSVIAVVLVTAGLTAFVSCGDPHADLAEAGLLRIEDFPPGFRALPVEEEEPSGRGAGGDQPEECAAAERASRAGVQAEGSSDMFSSGESFAGNDVIVYRDGEVATFLLDAWSDEAEAVPCVELLLSAIIGFAAENPIVAAALGSYEVAATPLPIPEWGEARVGWRGLLTIQGREVSDELTVDVVVVRQGRAVSTFYVVGSGQPADALREEVVPKAVARLLDA